MEKTTAKVGGSSADLVKVQTAATYLTGKGHMNKVCLASSCAWDNQLPLHKAKLLGCGVHVYGSQLVQLCPAATQSHSPPVSS